jgi:dihydrodipicolinate synthase/N-acetylneuraminate lyase
MIDIQTAAQLSGLWSAIPSPWTASGTLDEGILGRNIEKLAAVPCDGIYTTDSDGEFYAMELDEFRAFVATFARYMRGAPCGVQVGVTWTNATGILDRIKACLDHGISAVHVGFPYWMPLNCDDVQRFWETLAQGAPRAQWIHYNTPRCHVRMTGADYRDLAAQYPEQFIGTKLGTQNFYELSETIAASPNVAHFVTDFMTLPAMLLGARGVYSFWVNSLPRWQRQLVDHCLARRWDDAAPLQLKFNHWEQRCVEPVVARGYLHGIIGRARAAAAGFLDDSGVCREPYGPVPPDIAAQLAADFRNWWAEEIREESSANRVQ